MEFITLAEVLQHIDSGRPFDIEVTSADVKRGTGGQLKAYAQCVKHMNQPVKYSNKTIVARTAAPKNPNHHHNSTRNLYLMQKREVKTVHVRLITRFNGKVVS